MNARKVLAAGLTAIACLCFSAGLVFPLIKIKAAAGKWTPLVKLVAADELSERPITLPGGIVTLWNDGDILLACLLGTLSLILPIAKFSVLWWESFSPADLPDRLLVFFRFASRYAMVEVFLIALTVILVKGMPGGSQISVEIGTHAFTASVVLGLLAGEITGRSH
jgi:paraquat-inducible protein A